jgi:Tfp pilus assembly protein PilO
MKQSDRVILAGLLAIGLAAAFWFAILSPKRDHATELQSQAEALRSSVEQQQQTVAMALEARRDFGAAYHRLVVLGKAVPADADTPSLLVEVQGLSHRAGIQFRSLELSQDGQSVAPPAPPATDTSTTAPGLAAPASTTDASATPTATTTTTVATPTEAAAATLPIGAAVGPAGLPAMPYTLKFRGDFFDIADFLRGLDGLVHYRGGRASVTGRLLTVDGFNLSADLRHGFPKLSASLAVTTYVTPADQGLTAGASPTAPAPADTTTPAPVSTTAPAAAPTATTTPPVP